MMTTWQLLCWPFSTSSVDINGHRGPAVCQGPGASQSEDQGGSLFQPLPQSPWPLPHCSRLSERKELAKTVGGKWEGEKTNPRGSDSALQIDQSLNWLLALL